jgi:hypothetical protein
MEFVDDESQPLKASTLQPAVMDGISRLSHRALYAFTITAGY